MKKMKEKKIKIKWLFEDHQQAKSTAEALLWLYILQMHLT